MTFLLQNAGMHVDTPIDTPVPAWNPHLATTALGNSLPPLTRRPVGEPSDAEEPPKTAGEAFQLWGKAVWRSLRYLGVDSALLLDATQEVFAIVHEKWDTLLDPSARKAWVFGIARNVALANRRKSKRARSFTGDQHESNEVESSAACGAASPAALAEDRELVRFLEGQLAELSEDERLLITLTMIEGCSVREAALTLRLPERRAGWLVEKTLANLKSGLTRWLRRGT
jgi:RNA polymerase sigma factor (sigma-70 family)